MCKQLYDIARSMYVPLLRSGPQACNTHCKTVTCKSVTCRVAMPVNNYVPDLTAQTETFFFFPFSDRLIEKEKRAPVHVSLW